MVQSCCAVGCFNKASKGTSFSFHSFPWKNPDRVAKWISRISRVATDGKPWYPSKNDRVCSAHFLQSDYYLGMDQKKLREDAVPSVFPQHPAHKQLATTPRRPSPRKRKIDPTQSSSKSLAPEKAVCLDHCYTHSSLESHLAQTQKQLDKSKDKEVKLTNELRKVKATLVRREKKITEVLQEIARLQLLSADEVSSINESFAPETLTIIENEIKSLKVPKTKMQYSEDLKAFAVSLHFYSSQAYEYVKKYLHLPHADTIRRWASSYNVQPGFLGDVLASLKAQVDEDPSMSDVALIFDAMAIRKQVVYDQKLQRYVGFIDYGNHNIASTCDRLATESLTFLIVGQKKFFKHPIGYFLIDKVDAKQQAEMVKEALCLLGEAGFNVVSVVCDGAFSNQATATQLGCSLKPEDVTSEIDLLNLKNQKVSMMFDACHLIKNVRNCLGELKTIFYGDEKIEWRFIAELHNFQLKSNLHLANKLRGTHLDFIKNKMKVALAVQTLSSSVATAIEFLRDDLQLPEFANSEATCTFIKLFDKLFDLCNSSNKFAKGYKSAITRENFEAKRFFMKEAIQYILALKHNNRPLVCGRRKTGFVGFIVTLKALEKIAEKLFEKEYRYVLTYRLSQDHLETLFGRIRRRGGWNNNPNATQFRHALRALLQKNGVLSSSRGNCVPPADNTLCAADDNNTMSFGLDADQQASEESAVDPMYRDMIKALGSTSPYHDDALYYISGFIARKIQINIKCTVCSTFLSSRKANITHPAEARFTTRRDNGGLQYASSDLYTIIKTADKALRHQLITDKRGPLRGVSESTILKVTSHVIEELGANIFVGLKDHCTDCHIMSEDDHPTQIVKEVCRRFCNMMLHHHGKLFNQRHICGDSATVRHKLNKTILFLHQ